GRPKDPIAEFERKLAGARERVKQLARDKEFADKALAVATAEARNGGDPAPLFELGLRASDLKKELEIACETLSGLENVDRNTKRERAEFRLKEKLAEARRVRD